MKFTIDITVVPGTKHDRPGFVATATCRAGVGKDFDTTPGGATCLALLSIEKLESYIDENFERETKE